MICSRKVPNSTHDFGFTQRSLAKLTEGRLFSTAKLAELSPGTLGAEAQRSKALPAAWIVGWLPELLQGFLRGFGWYWIPTPRKKTKKTEKTKTTDNTNTTSFVLAVCFISTAHIGMYFGRKYVPGAFVWGKWRTSGIWGHGFGETDLWVVELATVTSHLLSTPSFGWKVLRHV